jgi:hypothetical protein
MVLMTVTSQTSRFLPFSEDQTAIGIYSPYLLSQSEQIITCTVLENITYEVPVGYWKSAFAWMGKEKISH